jgi:hypothetical protein
MIWAATISHEATATTVLVIEYRGGPLHGRDEVVRTLPMHVRCSGRSSPAGRWAEPGRFYRPTGEVTTTGRHIYQFDEADG